MVRRACIPTQKAARPGVLLEYSVGAPLGAFEGSHCTRESRSFLASCGVGAPDGRDLLLEASGHGKVALSPPTSPAVSQVRSRQHDFPRCLRGFRHAGWRHYRRPQRRSPWAVGKLPTRGRASPARKPAARRKVLKQEAYDLFTRARACGRTSRRGRSRRRTGLGGAARSLQDHLTTITTIGVSSMPVDQSLGHYGSTSAPGVLAKCRPNRGLGSAPIW